MAYNKILTAEDILAVAVRMVEQGHAEGLSLRAIASDLGVKAPSLYRYFEHKGALRVAVAEEVLRQMHRHLQPAGAPSDPNKRLSALAHAYLQFARQHQGLYAFLFQVPIEQIYGSPEGKAFWNSILEAASAVSGTPDDTTAAVAIWSFLHGYTSLEHAGAFGASGPRDALDYGLAAFIGRHTSPPPSVQSGPPSKARRKQA